jgi:RecB family endonuclease NucS
MNKPQLGRLQRVSVRDYWVDEAREFTPWLAESENIVLLGQAIGVELEVEAQEKNVGPFSADILCKDTLGGQYVLIENQLERTDHTHLGQLLTYAAGLDAVTVVWVAGRFTEEHRAALDWLN